MVRQLLAGGICVALACGIALAEDQQAKSGKKGDHQGKYWLTSECTGKTVINQNDESIGSVHDVVIDSDGNMVLAIVQQGTFGDYYAVAPSALKPHNREGTKVVQWSGTQELKTQPKFNSSEFKELDDPQFMSRVHKQRASNDQPQQESQGVAAITGNADENTRTSLYGGNANYMRASKLIGAWVYNSENNANSDINDLVVKNHRVEYVIVGRGGLGGLGETELVVPFKALEFRAKAGEENPRIVLNKSAKELESAPVLETGASAAEQINNDAFCKTVDRFYKSESKSN